MLDKYLLLEHTLSLGIWVSQQKKLHPYNEQQLMKVYSWFWRQFHKTQYLPTSFIHPRTNDFTSHTELHYKSRTLRVSGLEHAFWPHIINQQEKDNISPASLEFFQCVSVSLRWLIEASSLWQRPQLSLKTRDWLKLSEDLQD